MIALSANDANSQSGPCTLKLADLPQAAEMYGFRLGMTPDQVKARVPQVVMGETDDLGVSKTTINPDFDPRIDKSSFSGLRSVSLDFLDARLTSLWLGYDGSFKWRTVDEFVGGINRALGLPHAWQTWKVRGQQLKCADFQMTVSIIAEGPSFRIVNLDAAEQLAERRQMKEEQQTAAATTESEAAVSSAEELVADSETRTYYPADCPPTRPIAPKHRVVFKSTEEAEKGGYKRAKNCVH
jgi:hypothetical protein